MRFCPTCGGSVDLRMPPGDTAERHVCARCGTIHYQNPKVVVGAVCSFGDRVLLCRRAIEPRRGFWTIPAGYLEIGESTEAAARREAYEEAYARIEIQGLLAVYNVVRIHQVQIHYRARLIDPEVAPGEETLELDLFRWQDIPWSELAFPTVTWVLRRAIELEGRTPPYPVMGNPEGAEPPSPFESRSR
ncbi:MAG: NUDIX hydrolase [Geminicoccaceae bacterium]|nr:NUDIX hydrolase [Geminicoccaceae bacterium]